MTTEHTDVTIPAGELINRHAAITAIRRIDAARGSLETCVYVANALNEAQTALQLLPAVLLPSLSGPTGWLVVWDEKPAGMFCRLQKEAEHLIWNINAYVKNDPHTNLRTIPLYAHPAPVSPSTKDNDEDEAYEIGKRDGYEDAIQDIDLAMGGDGEFKGSMVPGETVDVPAMKARIIERLALSGNGEAEPVVKPLEWENGEARSALDDLYSVHRFSEDVYSTRKNGTAFTGWEATEAAAKDVARADYEQRIRSALAHPAPVSPVAPMPGWTMRLAHIEQRTPIEKQAAELVAGIENLGGHPLLSSAQSAVDLALRTLGKWHDDGELGANAPASPAPTLHTVAGVAETLEFNAQHIVAEEELGDALAMLDVMRRVMHEEAAKLHGLILTPDAKDKRIAELEAERVSLGLALHNTLEEREDARAKLALNAKERGNAELIERWQKKLKFVEESEYRTANLGPGEHVYSELLTPTEYRQIVAALSRAPAPEGMGAPTRIEHLFAAAKARFEAMTPEQQEAEMRAQRESWVRGQTAMGNDAQEAKERAEYRASLNKEEGE